MKLGVVNLTEIRCIPIAVILALVETLGFPAAAAAPMSPAAGSDAVRTLLDGEPELRLEYRVEQVSAPAETITIGLAKDYHYKNSALGLWVYDYRSRRIFRVSTDGKFTNDSLYAEVWYRRAELENRAMISAALQKAGVDAPKDFAAHDPFWAETELGLTTAKFDRPNLQRAETADRIAWRLNNVEVVAIRYRREAVPGEVRSALRRFWPSIANIHPQIADEFALEGRLPEELWIKQMVHAGKSFETAHWVLIHAGWIKSTKYPLPPGLVAVATRPSDAYPQIFQTLATAVAEQRKPPSDDVYRTRIESAIAHGAGLEALVWTLEVQLSAGANATCAGPSTSDFCTILTRSQLLAKMDPRTAIAFAKQSPDIADRSQFDSLPNAYVLRLLWATRPPGHGVTREESEADLLHALQASPVANFCKDTGDFYARSWQPFAAWQVWDLGRLMVGHKNGDLLDQVDSLEAEVMRREPTLF